MGMGRRRVRGHQIKEPRVPGRAYLALSRRRSRPGATRRGKRITPTARRDPGRGAWLLDEEGAVALTGGLARARVAHSAEAGRAEQSRAERNRGRSARGRRRKEGALARGGRKERKKNAPTGGAGTPATRRRERVTRGRVRMGAGLLALDWAGASVGRMRGRGGRGLGLGWLTGLLGCWVGFLGLVFLSFFFSTHTQTNLNSNQI